MNELSPLTINTIADALAQDGYVIFKKILDFELVQGLSQDAKYLKNFSEAKVGRGTERKNMTTIRSDKILWIEGKEESGKVYLLWMESLRKAMNIELFMGLAEYESHFSHYELGTFYQKHFDVLRGANKRLLTTVFYLTDNWQEGDGGELLIYGEDGETVLQKVSPRRGTMVIFLSDKFAHEVLPSNKDRYSIAGWFKGA